MEVEGNIEFVEFEYNPEQFENTISKNDHISEDNQNSSSDSQNKSNSSSSSSSSTENQNSQLVCKKPLQWNYIEINPYLNDFNNTFSLFNGFTVTNDGVVRFNYNLDQVSFGYWQQKVVCVSNLIKLGLVDVAYSNISQYSKNNFQDALNFLRHVPNIDFQKVCTVMNQTKGIIDGLKYFLHSMIPEEMREGKEQEYQLYLKHCFNYLEYFCQINPNHMFYYTILRLNLQEGDSEIAHTGYSKSYLQLLGIDGDQLSQIIMRNKKVDLIQKKSDITQQGISGVSFMAANLEEEHFEQNITTFDGFPLKLKFIKRAIKHGFEANKIAQLGCQYGFVIVEIDVDMYDLQQLIEYRQRCMQKQNNYEDLIRKELSLLYEDVEYSVQSQMLIDKYYSENIEQLKNLQHNKCNSLYKYNYKMLTV